jgi:hypothetical protein
MKTGDFPSPLPFPTNQRAGALTTMRGAVRMVSFGHLRLVPLV